MNRTITLLIPLIVFLQTTLNAQHTFSIVAIDTITGEVGSAGATCLDDSHIAGGAKVISAVVPGTGAIHVQALLHPTNYYEAVSRLNDGYNPANLIQWLLDNDAQNNPEVRQYGLAAFDSAGILVTDAFTGTNTLDEKGHIIGATYAIQGNILLGLHILDSMEAGFLRTEGTLADKLMAAMQGANVAGADSRCFNEGVSSLSAFLRIAKPDDDFDTLFLDLLVSKTPYGVEPIDSLQKQYNAWKFPVSVYEPLDRSHLIEVFPVPAKNELKINLSNLPLSDNYNLVITNTNGKILFKRDLTQPENTIDMAKFSNGIYFMQIFDLQSVVYNGKVLVE